MKIKLKVLKGSNAGREVKIPTPKCLIGRSDECHLRPKSEAISRRHCVIFVKEGNLLVRDLGSKNGTYVNGERISEDVKIKSGDTVHFGPLGFEVLIDHTLGGDKQPKVNSVKEAAVRVSSNKSTALLEDSDISSWLDEADAAIRDDQFADPDTRQVVLDQTDQMTLQKAIEERAKLAKERAAAQAAEEDSVEVSAEETKSKKKGPGKLPERTDSATKDSQEAAAGALRKLFSNR